MTPNHLKPPQCLHFALPYATSQLVIAKTTNLMYRLNVQVTAYGRQTVFDKGVVRSCDPLQNFGATFGTAEPKADKFLYTSRLFWQQDDISPTNRGGGYGHVTVLKFCRLS